MPGETWDITERVDLERAVKDILTEAKPADSAFVLALHGDLGSGKTTFVQTLAKQLGVTDTVTSPTFVIMKKYPTTAKFNSLIHIDAYRLDSVDELKILGFESELAVPGTMICVEWADKVAALLPSHAIHLYFTLDGESRRLVKK